jgi:hypothetical protein
MRMSANRRTLCATARSSRSVPHERNFKTAFPAGAAAQRQQSCERVLPATPEPWVSAPTHSTEGIGLPSRTPGVSAPLNSSEESPSLHPNEITRCFCKPQAAPSSRDGLGKTARQCAFSVRGRKHASFLCGDCNLPGKRRVRSWVLVLTYADKVP